MKIFAGAILGAGIFGAIITVAAMIVNVGTVERQSESSFQSLVIIVLGAILWQLVTLSERK